MTSVQRLRRFLVGSWRYPPMRSITWGLAAVLLLTSTPRAQCLSWSSEFFHGPNGTVYGLGFFDSGSGPDLYVGGEFSTTSDGTVFIPWIARWNGSSWSPVGSGMNDLPFTFYVFDDGAGPDLYVGGYFTSVGGVPWTRGVARWDGSSWSAVGFGLNGTVGAMIAFDDGTGPALYAGGGFNGGIARWDGSSWSTVGGGLNSAVGDMTIFDDGTGSALYVGGAFTSAGGAPVDRIAKWDGSMWSPLGGGVGGGGSSPAVLSLQVFDEGNGPALFVGGNFSNASGVPLTSGFARWDGTGWSAVGGGTKGSVHAQCLFDDGSGPALYAVGGFFLDGSQYIARWDGVAWSALGTGMNEIAYTLTVMDDGSGSGPSLFAGGDFTRAGVIQSWAVAKWRACESPIDTFCFGDGTVADCPCSNLGPLERGCRNSIGLGARLTTTGSRLPDTLVFQVTDERPTALTIFLQGNALISSSADFGDGLRCAGGDLKRLYVKSASAGSASAPQPGDPSVTARSAVLGDPIAPGSTRYYQTYYRDPNPNFCTEASGGSTFNSSNGVRVVW